MKKTYLWKCLEAILFFGVAALINSAASFYATVSAGNPVPDILLDHLPVMNVAWVFVYGSILFLASVFVAGVAVPKAFPFVIKSSALIVAVRAFFVVLTHLGIPNGMIAEIRPEFLKVFFFSADLFFSGHAGFPFLFTLVFWHDNRWRAWFMVCTVVLASVALIGRYHYSIDVFAAFFITFGIYHMARYFFAKEYRMMVEARPTQDPDPLFRPL